VLRGRFFIKKVSEAKKNALKEFMYKKNVLLLWRVTQKMCPDAEIVPNTFRKNKKLNNLYGRN
jgi:hypothetical protein